MSQSGSFGLNYKKSFGTDPAIVPAKLGDIGSDVDGEFLFIKASAAIAQYAFVVIAPDNTAAEASGAYTVGRINGVAQVALAINEYGWVWIGGVHGGGIGKGIRGKIAASYVIGTPLLTTAAAGVADDAGSTTLKNVFGTITTTGAASIELFSTNIISLN